MYEDRIQWITHKGFRVLSINYQNLTPPELPGIFAKLLDVVKKEPAGSTLYLTDVRGLHFNTSMIGLFSKLGADTKPYDKAGAIMGVTGLVKVMYDGFSKFAKVPMKTFDKREDALEWLIKI